jgi:hypothetical protein
MKESYITKSGCLVFHYDLVLDNYREAEKEALLKHRINGAKITTIAVTTATDFLQKEAV